MQWKRPETHSIKDVTSSPVLGEDHASYHPHHPQPTINSTTNNNRSTIDKRNLQRQDLVSNALHSPGADRRYRWEEMTPQQGTAGYYSISKENQKIEMKKDNCSTLSLNEYNTMTNLFSSGLL